MALITEQKAMYWLIKFWKPINNIFIGLKNEVVNTFAVGLSKYIYDREKKLSKINTFISREKKVDFYKVYFSQTILSPSGRFNSNTVLQNLFRKSNVVAIVATAGSGKTMLMKHIFLSCKNEFFKIPIFIELRDFNNKEFDFLDYMYTYILSNRIKPSHEIVERALQNGNFLFLLDGYDELMHEKKINILDEIQMFIDLYPQNQFVFSSRPGTGIEYSARIINHNIENLSSGQIVEFIEGVN
jgi:predicted NACHT family NTPase